MRLPEHIFTKPGALEPSWRGRLISTGGLLIALPIVLAWNWPVPSLVVALAGGIGGGLLFAAWVAHCDYLYPFRRSLLDGQLLTGRRAMTDLSSLKAVSARVEDFVFLSGFPELEKRLFWLGAGGSFAVFAALFWVFNEQVLSFVHTPQATAYVFRYFFEFAISAFLLFGALVLSSGIYVALKYLFVQRGRQVYIPLNIDQMREFDQRLPDGAFIFRKLTPEGLAINLVAYSRLGYLMNTRGGNPDLIRFWQSSRIYLEEFLKTVNIPELTRRVEMAREKIEVEILNRQKWEKVRVPEFEKFWRQAGLAPEDYPWLGEVPGAWLSPNETGEKENAFENES